MLGHPGISAYEFAGAVERHNHEERAWERATEQVSFKHATRRASSSSGKSEWKEDVSLVGAKTSEPQQLQTPVDERTLAQRRRGTFMNHTPRNHEVRLSAKLSHRPTSSEDLGRLYAAYRGSSDENTTTEASWSAQHSSYGSFTVQQGTRGNADAPVELDSREIPLNPLRRAKLTPGKIMHPLPTVPTILPRQRHSQGSSATASIKSSQTGLSKRSLRSFLSRNASLDASLHQRLASFENHRPSTSASNKPKLRAETANSKRRRRQTPYKIPKPIVTELGRHAPLEPLVLHHRREVTGSDVDPLPPHVDIMNELSEAATLLAINEYFDSQENTLKVQQSTELAEHVEPSALKSPPDEAKHVVSPSTPPKNNASDKEDPKDVTPSLPERNPDRLSRINSPATPPPRRTKSASELSVQSDFTSAAKGQYSPYDERFDTVPKILRRVPVPLPLTTSPPSVHVEGGTQAQGRSTSSASGKLAPRIPGHDELANTRLNDFNYFLRMTGPSPPSAEVNGAGKKKKRGLRVIKVRGRKERGMENGKARESEGVKRLPACAQQKTTSFGTRHLEIRIPDKEPASGLTHPDPNEGGGGAPEGMEKPGSGRRDFEAAWTDEMMHPLASPTVERAINPSNTMPSAPRSPLRSPRPSPKSPKAVPVEDHPLLVSRKEQTRGRKLRDLQRVKEKVEEKEALEERVKKLDWLVGELAGALAREAGFEEGLGAEEVLGAWKSLERRGR
ncbi:hypothetical protein BU23DRAFT_657110 [Bimuria novae-zelandiae CBS 107.79]|uniref:Uncharacterized protein n=1 Tax=Bimuria novae-zelandiae CBS 107.79 TaxID=1447943 RepID=A0A6A5VLI2_9PLEO|nr:hypothetical protein BU23DRAFT_657110 [Bimuria novae-zelandiae CBS 107.79]